MQKWDSCTKSPSPTSLPSVGGDRGGGGEGHCKVLLCNIDRALKPEYTGYIWLQLKVSMTMSLKSSCFDFVALQPSALQGNG